MKKQSTNKLVIIGTIAIVIIILAASYSTGFFTNTDSSMSNNLRSVDWIHVHGLGIDPDDSSILYIATHGDFYHSISGSPPVKVDKTRADYMAFNAPPVSGVPLYASGHPITGGNTGLIKSTDGGATWQIVSKVIEPPADFHAMTISKQNPDIIIGFDSAARGLFKSTDAGNTWESLDYPEYISALAFSPIDSKTIFAGTGNGIFKSVDGGKIWSPLGHYKGLTVYALSFDDEGALFASVETFGLVRSDDYGNSWDNMQDIDLTVTSITADANNQILYVGGHSSGGFQEVYKMPYDMSIYDVIGTNRGL